MLQRFDEINYSFMIQRHTKCSADAGFGKLKRKLRKNNVLTKEDFRNVVNSSAKSITGRQLCDNDWYDWKSFLGQFFLDVKGVTSHQYFQMNSACDDILAFTSAEIDDNGVMVRKTEEKRYPMFKKSVSRSDVVDAFLGNSTTHRNFREFPLEPDGFNGKRYSHIKDNVLREFISDPGIRLQWRSYLETAKENFLRNNAGEVFATDDLHLNNYVEMNGVDDDQSTCSDMVADVPLIRQRARGRHRNVHRKRNNVCIANDD